MAMLTRMSEMTWGEANILVNGGKGRSALLDAGGTEPLM